MRGAGGVDGLAPTSCKVTRQDNASPPGSAQSRMI